MIYGPDNFTFKPAPFYPFQEISAEQISAPVCHR